MHVLPILYAALSVFAIGAQASSCYRECECWDKVTGARDADVGRKACMAYIKQYETALEWKEDTKVCREVSSNPMNNGKWDKLCREQGTDSHFQQCYHKSRPNGC